MPSSLQDLFDRRVPQYAALYLGGGWGLVQFVAFLEERYMISPHWTDICLLVLMLFLPSVLLFTYNHGRPGADRWRRSERIAIPANVLVVVVAVWLFFGGKDLGAMTRTVTVRDENGNTVERAVPKASYRKRLLFFTPAGGDSAARRLGQGLLYGTLYDLMQDPFVDMNATPFIREKLEEAGFDDGDRVPLALQRRIASRLHYGYVASGEAMRDANGVAASIVVYDSEKGREVSRRRYVAPDVMSLSDSLSIGLRRDIGLPEAHMGQVADLPASEILTSSPEAYGEYLSGMDAVTHGRWPEGEAALSRALALDPTFAIAALGLFQTRLYSGDNAGSGVALAAAMEHVYRIPERRQFGVKAARYQMTGETDKALAVLEMGRQLYPDEASVHTQLASFYEMMNRWDDAIAEHRAVLELDPSQVERLRAIGSLLTRSDRYDEALEALRLYTEQEPDDPAGFMDVGQILSLEGDHDGARDQYEKALMLEPGEIDARLRLADLALEVGEPGVARRQLADALEVARTDAQRAEVYMNQAMLERWLGRPAAAIERLADWRGAAEDLPPFQIALTQMTRLEVYALAGRDAEGRRLVEGARAVLAGPFAGLEGLGTLNLELGREEPWPGELDSASEQLEALSRSNAFGFLRPFVLDGRAHAAEARGDYGRALELYRERREAAPTSVGTRVSVGRVLREMGRNDAALAALDSALALAPGDPRVLLEMGLTRLEKGQVAEAREALERGAEIWRDAEPAFAPARVLRERLATVTRARQG